MPPKVIEGPALLHVGERPPGDKQYATDEYVLAPPGTIVAPRRRGEKPTAENAMRAISRQARRLGLMGDKSMSKLTGYQAYNKARGMSENPRPAARGAGVGPPAYRHMVAAANGAGTIAPASSSPGGQAGATVDPTAEALKAINQVSTARGVDNATAANMLSPGAAPMAAAPLGNEIPFAAGTGAMGNFLTTLLGAGQTLGPETMVAMLGFLSQLGMIDPRLYGVTDPAVVRQILAEGKGVPTLDMRRQLFNESLFGFSGSSPSRGSVPTVTG